MDFFGGVLDNDLECIFSFDYQGEILKYRLIINDREDVVAISGDRESPFQCDSFYEFSVACDLIRLRDYSGQKMLEFWYGAPENPMNLRLMILKRPNGDLKVWPAYPFPPDHPVSLATHK